MKDTSGIAADRLMSFIERIERLEEEKAALSADVKEVFAEAKSNGFNTKLMRQMIKERKLEPSEWEESRALGDIYRRALGILADTPLGEAARARELGLAPSAPSTDTKH